MDNPPLPFSNRSQLIPISVVRALRGLSAEAILALMESGELRFAFNFSARFPKSQVCHWRFWLREVIAPNTVARLTLLQAIALMLGEHRQRWRGTELAQLLLLSRPTIHRLHQSGALRGKIKGNTLWVERPALETLLTTRLYS